MALQTFTAGQVLTAAQVTALQTNDFNQTVSNKTDSTVLVAADKGTRVVMNKATATTITVNTGLFNAGDTLFIQNIGAGVCTITAGTATVSTAGSLALAQNAGGTLYFTSTGVAIFLASAGASASGLTLVSATTIGTTVSSVTVSNAFSATYDSYFIEINGGVASASNTAIKMVLGASVTGYYYSGLLVRYASTTANIVANNAAGILEAGTGHTTFLNMAMQIDNPFLANRTLFNMRNVYTDGAAYLSGFHDVATSFTNFTLTPATGTLTGGTIHVYGYSKV